VQALLDQPVSTGSFVDFLGGPAPPQLDEQARATLAGRQLGSYQVLALAGRGGMGEVYRAHDDRLGRDVAIKVLPPVFSTDAERLARFGGEARALAALNHPHIASIYGLEDVEGVPALVLEFVAGETLGDRLHRGPIPVRDALPIARQIADALDGAHRKGIVHRDLKPANIKITPDGADGRSLVTAVALRSSSLWLRTPAGERQVSIEGNAVNAKFARDGTKLFYRIVSHLGASPMPGEMRVVDVDSRRVDVLLPGLRTLDYDVSPDGQRVVVEATDPDGVSRLWIAAVDRQSPPRQLPNLEGRQPRFGPGGEIYFRRRDGAAAFVYVVGEDGTGVRRVVEQPVMITGNVSPDGRWITGWSGVEAAGWQAFPLHGGAPRLLGHSRNASGWQWSPRGDWMVFHSELEGSTYLVPLAAGEMFPPFPREGLHSERDVAKLPGARKVEGGAVPGPSPDVYAFHRQTIQRNLHRIPIR
jgi:hypothetical protein